VQIHHPFIKDKDCYIKMTDTLKCANSPCADVEKKGFIVPLLDIDPAQIKLVMITEAPPVNNADYFYAPGSPFYLQTTLQAFKKAGEDVKSIKDILGLGVYITTAIKCPKAALTISPGTMNNCAALLEKEVALFPGVKVFFLGGDAAIKMMNGIWKKQTGKRVIPAGATYKIRKGAYYLGDVRVFPSYTPAGKNILIEKGKMGVIAEDLREAMKTISK
jgi:uracil-DNA glycosylase